MLQNVKSHNEDPLTIRCPASEDALTVLQLALSGMPAEEQASRCEAVLALVDSGKEWRANLLEARRGGRLVGAVFAQPLPGRAAVVWFPRLVLGEPIATAEKLLQGTCGRLDRSGIREADVLLRSRREADEAVLRATGFLPLADLLYMVSQPTGFPHTEPETALRFEAYRAESHARLVRVIESSYEGTLDCPGLNGVRSIDDVLTGYRATGVFSPSWWLIAVHRGEDAGCLLLSDHPEHGNAELVYMGLKPRWRGRGWGIGITRHAQWLAHQAKRSRLVLAVDAANRPAVAMYEAAGFEVWDRRAAFLRVSDRRAEQDSIAQA